ncbi:hypothetical protein OBBRIDRAFT_101775 [Obba rivulosa]|uniref:F-box domain-containing protein n=1 Tax=Obba rivulosa TaxID=1052685 RepID=A0A8E2J4U0_9APHY|nr:hypothetical protein OBBRIDRAFT_101775 [Obba rivulosa]
MHNTLYFRRACPSRDGFCRSGDASLSGRWLSAFGKELGRGRLRRVLHDTPAQPALQYNFDVLECILHHLPQHDLHNTSLVCREWALASRRPLYARLKFDSDDQSTSLLARTLRTCPHLRSLVHFVELQISIHDGDPAVFDWLHLIQEGNVTELIVYQCAFGKDFTTFILSSPFVRSVRHLEGRSDFIHTKEHLYGCLTIPNLESLSLYVPDDLDIILPVTVPRKLTHLSVSSYAFPFSTIPLLAAVGPQLQQFDLDSGVDPPLDDELPEFIAALEKCHHWSTFI